MTGLEAVIHMASPFHYKWSDPHTELVKPAVVGTTAILKALKHSATTVKRVIVTSSFASIIDPYKITDPSTVFSEASWNPSTLSNLHESPLTAYRVSKTLAERAAWDFMANEKPDFDLVTICPPLVLGPVVHYLPTLDSINTSNGRIVDLLRGKWRDTIVSTGAANLWIDVRDVAKAHVAAMERPRLVVTVCLPWAVAISIVISGKL